MEQLNKRQRELERRIRKTKRGLQTLKTALDACKDDKLKYELKQDYDRTAYTLSKQNKAYESFCNDNELRPLADRLRIANWDRAQAAKAAGAARRYVNAKG